MKLRGLPLELRPGPVELRVSGFQCDLLQRCFFCKFYNRIYFICHNNHITCPDCFLPDSPLNKLTRPQYEAYCKQCGSRVSMFRFEIPVPLLQNMKFTCGCNFTGRLADIKKHVKSDQFSMRCSSGVEEPPKSSDDFDVELARIHSDIMDAPDDFIAQIASIQEKFKEKMGKQLEAAPPNSTILTKSFAETTERDLGIINNRLKKMEAQCIRLRRCSRKLTPAVGHIFTRTFDPRPEPARPGAEMPPKVEM